MFRHPWKRLDKYRLVLVRGNKALLWVLSANSFAYHCDGESEKGRPIPHSVNRFQREDLDPLAFAGLWEFARIGCDEILSAAIIVGEPAALHDRMSVIPNPEDYDSWLGSPKTKSRLR